MSRRVFRILSLLFVALFVASLGGQAVAAPKKKTPGDPPGNNGTVKIEQEAAGDEDLGNEPHGDDCRIWLEFYGFDAGQTANITFAAHPPTKAKDDKPLIYSEGVKISDDQAGGGPNDPEQTEDTGIEYGYNLAKALEAGGVTAHEKQGYHIKLSVDVKDDQGNDVPGASKHKVFWLAPCDEETAPPPETAATASILRIAKEQVGKGGGPFTFDLNCDHAPLNQTFTLKAGEKLDIADVPAGTICAVTETDKKGAKSTTITEDPVFDAAGDGTVQTVADKATIVTFKNEFPGDEVIAPPPNNDLRVGPAGSGGSPGTSVGGTNTSTSPGSSVLAASETAPEAAAATLPRTGSNPRPLTAAGLWTLAAGGLALLAGRRPRRA